jgi:GDPmannose 4,6-dehydratase
VRARVSFGSPEYTGDVTGLGTTASSSLRPANAKSLLPFLLQQMFGATPPPQGKTPFYPRSPYGAARYCLLLDGGQLPGGVRHVRQQQDSQPVPRRGETFKSPARSPRDREDQGRQQKELFLGNLDARRD